MAKFTIYNGATRETVEANAEDLGSALVGMFRDAPHMHDQCRDLAAIATDTDKQPDDWAMAQAFLAITINRHDDESAARD